MHKILLTCIAGIGLTLSLPSHAQNVAVPQGKSGTSIFNFFSPSKPATPETAQPSSSTTGSAPSNATPVPSTSSSSPSVSKSSPSGSTVQMAVDPNRPTGPATLQAALALRPVSLNVPVDTQQTMIANEQKKIDNLRRSLEQVKLSASTIPIIGENLQEKEQNDAQRKISQDTAVSMTNDIIRSQQRLQILQSGPITYDTLKRLYQ